MPVRRDKSAMISAQTAESPRFDVMTNDDAQGASFHVNTIFTAKLGRRNWPIVLLSTASAS